MLPRPTRADYGVCTRPSHLAHLTPRNPCRQGASPGFEKDAASHFGAVVGLETTLCHGDPHSHTARVSFSFNGGRHWRYLGSKWSKFHAARKFGTRPLPEGVRFALLMCGSKTETGTGPGGGLGGSCTDLIVCSSWSWMLHWKSQ